MPRKLLSPAEQVKGDTIVLGYRKTENNGWTCGHHPPTNQILLVRWQWVPSVGRLSWGNCWEGESPQELALAPLGSAFYSGSMGRNLPRPPYCLIPGSTIPTDHIMGPKKYMGPPRIRQTQALVIWIWLCALPSGPSLPWNLRPRHSIFQSPVPHLKVDRIEGPSLRASVRIKRRNPYKAPLLCLTPVSSSFCTTCITFCGLMCVSWWSSWI